jgi:hypothetical protein
MYGDCRIAVGVALFFAYTFHYIFVGLAHFWKKAKLDKMAFFEKRMWLYGMICSLSTGVI